MSVLSSVFDFLVSLVGEARPVVPVVRLQGVIGAGSGPMQSGLSLATVAGSLEAAFNMKGAKAVALAINSPGGSPVQSALIYKRIRALAEEKNLRVYAFAEDVAASGGYMIACAADEIYADESSILGSIGVVSAGFGFPDLLKKVGVERRVYTSGENKSILDPFQPERSEDVERLKALQSDVHENFKDLVRKSRGAKLKTDDPELFSGAFWAGKQSVERGLADGIGDLRSIMHRNFGDEIKLKLVGGGRSWLRLPFGRSQLPGATHVTGYESGHEMAPFSGINGQAMWAGLMDALEARFHWNRFGL